MKDNKLEKITMTKRSVSQSSKQKNKQATRSQSSQKKSKDTASPQKFVLKISEKTHPRQTIAGDNLYIEDMACSDVNHLFTRFEKLSWISKIDKMCKNCFHIDTKISEHFTMMNPFTRFILVHNMKKPLGFCFITKDGYIHTVCVALTARGQKLCLRLFDHIIKKYGYMNLTLHVRVGKHMGQGLPPNKSAYNCYTKYGFLGLRDQACIILKDGLNCLMMRPSNGLYRDLSMFTKTIDGEPFDTTHASIQIAKGVFLVRHPNTKAYSFISFVNL